MRSTLATFSLLIALLLQGSGAFGQPVPVFEHFTSVSGSTASQLLGRSIACRSNGRVYIGAPGDTVGSSPFAGSVSYFDPASSSTIATIPNPEPTPNSGFGISVAVAGDISGDGINDLAVGAPFLLDRGRVFFFSDSGAPLNLSLTGEETFENFGEALLRFVDLNADGVEELIIGAPQRGNSSGVIEIRNGRSLTLIDTVRGQGPENFGTALARLGDINGGGRPELLVGAPGHNGVGRVYVISGENFNTIATITAPFTGRQFGQSVAGLPDLNGDGVAEFIVGAPAQETGFGGAIIYSGKQAADSGQGVELCNVTGNASSSNFGIQVLGLGKLGDDERFAFGVSADDAPNGQGLNGVGQIHLFRYEASTTSCPVDPVTPVIQGSVANQGFGKGVGGGPDCDFDGDGTGDLAVGSLGVPVNSSSGRVDFYLGLPPPAPTATPTPAPPVPTDVNLSFRLTDDGTMRLRVQFDQPPAGCKATIFGRLTSASRREKVFTVASFIPAEQTGRFKALDLPKLKQVGGSRAVLNMIVGVVCNDSEPIYSNVAARYLNCGLGDGDITPSDWTQAFLQGIAAGSPELEVQIRKRRSKPSRRPGRKPRSTR